MSDDVIDFIKSTLLRHDSKLDRILEQTTKTNGRVTTLEDNVKYHIENCSTKAIVQQLVATEKENNRDKKGKRWDVVKGIITTLITAVVSLVIAWLAIKLGLKP